MEEEPVFRKPIKRNKATARPRAIDASFDPDTAAASSTAASEVVRPTKVAKPNPLYASTQKAAGKPRLNEEFAHASDKRISQYDNKVAATNEQDTDRSADAQSQYERAQKLWADGGDVAADGSKIYRGQNAYRQYTGKSESFDNQVMSGAGPARAPVHYRATSLFDYKPDLCKDYKETGYCGFGDACKFLHDRSDYKSGWQLEKQWEDEQREKAHAAALRAFEDPDAPTSGSAGASSASVEDDGLPFACLSCREPWHAKSSPVMTKCQHYFCEDCALKQAAKTKRCFVCAENTGGIFNVCKPLQEKIARQQQQLKVCEEVQAGGEQSDESLLREYEEQKTKARGYTGGWGLA